MTDTLTEVDALVEAAFDEMECVCDISPCEGGKVAYYSSHALKSCVEGWLCQRHFRWVVDEWLPDLAARLGVVGCVRCQSCGTICKTEAEFYKVMTL